jgi:hypothetical protein
MIAFEPFFISLQIAFSTPWGSGDEASPSLTSSNSAVYGTVFSHVQGWEWGLENGYFKIGRHTVALDKLCAANDRASVLDIHLRWQKVLATASHFRLIMPDSNIVSRIAGHLKQLCGMRNTSSVLSGCLHPVPLLSRGLRVTPPSRVTSFSFQRNSSTSKTSVALPGILSPLP